jgi:hypothetical protein
MSSVTNRLVHTVDADGLVLPGVKQELVDKPVAAGTAISAP